MISKIDTQNLTEIAKYNRKLLEAKYGKYSHNMMGNCIEATDKIVEQCKKFGYNAEAKQVWCLYEKFEGCSDYCFEEHWIAKVIKGNDVIYIDITMDQFQWAFSKKLPKIYINKKQPNFYLSRKPGKITLDKCGWNDWYNYGDYVNNFNYYG